jgi:DNA-binding response OmpR family regulator
MNEDIKILIVEDELIAAEFLTMFLRKEGYKVVGICEEGKDAIEKAQQLKPDIIFMDIYLKDGISGCDATLKIVSNIETKIIFLTAYSDDEMLKYAMDIGAVNYLVKPYKETQILVALRMALGQSSISSICSKPSLVELVHGFTYDLEKKKFYKKKEEVKLAGRGLAVIKYLCEHKESVVSASELSNHIYGENISSSTLRALIFRIKEKLGYELIENVSGLGYKIIHA